MRCGWGRQELSGTIVWNQKLRGGKVNHEILSVTTVTWFGVIIIESGLYEEDHIL